MNEEYDVDNHSYRDRDFDNEKEMRLFLLQRARKNQDLARGVLPFFEGKMLQEATEEMNKETAYLEKWFKEESEK